jgi:GTP-binding protein
LPALAVLGRSNVGKSSLLNALLGVPVARVSQTPGRTQALYWYRVDDRFDLVDCPGYGFAKAAREARERFSTMIEALLAGPPHPAAALVLVDGRLAPMESDRSMVLFLRHAQVPTVVAATKWDDVRPAERFKRLRELSSEYASESCPLVPVSAKTGENLSKLAAILLERITVPFRRQES